MFSKVSAAKRAAAHGIAVHIVSGKKKGLMNDIVSGARYHGTFFSPAGNRLSHKKGWIAYNARPRGEVVIDEGAAKAIRLMGRSLLPTGIISVAGNFDVGDPVYCVNADGRRLAKGLTNYSSSDLRKIKGKKTAEIEKVLGYKYSDEAVHRDNLVIL
jgi:glutamate 5-kinase